MSENESVIHQLHTMTVKDLLEPLDSKDCFIDKSADIRQVFQQLKRKKHLWVVDSQTTLQLLGVITESDTIQLFAPACDPLQSFDRPTLQSFQFGLSMTAQEIMSVQPISAESDETIADVITKMKQHKIKQLAILDKDKQVIGELTVGHIMEVYLETLKSDTQIKQEQASKKNVLESL